jgi:glyoxylase-like metal-dependent hydrolase (beta-lactamase superfamily II)
MGEIAAIKGVYAISTGTGEQHPEHRHRTRKPLMWWVLTSRRWVPLPILCFLIEHRDGLVLFDTGLDPAIVSDPRYIDSAIGRFLLSRIFRLHIGPDDALDRRVAELGFDVADVSKVVVSHLHFDHVGGIRHVPGAELLVSEEEWAQLSGPQPERDWILREHIEIPGAKWRPTRMTPTDDPLFAAFGRSHDVMGDGSLTLLPTPGHTPGSICMLVRSAGMAPILLAGDLAYDSSQVLHDQLPGLGDTAQQLASFAAVRALRAQLPDLEILVAHDPRTPEALARALAGGREATGG